MIAKTASLRVKILDTEPLLEQRFKLVNRTCLSSITLLQLYNEGKPKLEFKIKDTEVLSLTADAWSSGATQHIVTVTMQFTVY